MLLFHFSFSVLVCLLLEWNLPTASETVCLYPSSAPPPNNLSAHVGLFQYFLSVQPIYYFFFVTYGVETQNRPIPSINGPAPVQPAPRDGPNSRWLLRTGTGPAPAPPVQFPNSRIRSAGASCGPERERNPTRRTGSASFSSPRFASAPSSFPTPHMATAVPAACLRAPCSSPAAVARRLGAGGPSLRKRHCAVAPVAAACGPAPPRMLDNGWYPRRRFS